MLFIFGTRGRWSRKSETGTFACPKCGGDRTWVRAVLRRWFTFFFIPFFPVGKPVAEAVQCTTCGTRYQPEVLTQPTTATMTAELQGAMRLAATAVVRAAGGGGSDAVAAVRGMGMFDYDERTQAHDAEQLSLADLNEHLAYLATALTLPGREQFLTTLVGIARSGGNVDAARQTLDDIGRHLDLSPAHVAGVLTMSSTSSPDAPPTAWPAPPTAPT
jgi:hypothetical protein